MVGGGGGGGGGGCFCEAPWDPWGLGSQVRETRGDADVRLKRYQGFLERPPRFVDFFDSGWLLIR